MKNLWCDLRKPILALAPLDDVTDVVFRQIVVEVAKPDVLFTEFTNVDALCSKGRASQERRLEFTEEQRPIVAQIWGSMPENFTTVACELVERGFDGVDINMGCPDKRFVGSGLCAGLIENRTLAAEIIAATQEGLMSFPLPLKGEGQGEGCIPLSVKTRIGIRTPITESWIAFLLEQNIDAITVHGRTVKAMSKVPADWDEIAKAVRVRDESGRKTLIIGNGDIMSRGQAFEHAEKYKVDGVMIGRGIFNNLWFFSPLSPLPAGRSLGEGWGERDRVRGKEKKLRLFLRHIQLWKETYGNSRPFDVLKKFAKVYISGFDGASDMRVRIMDTRSLGDLERCATLFVEELVQ